MNTKDICILVFFIGFIVGWFVFEIIHAMQDDDVTNYQLIELTPNDDTADHQLTELNRTTHKAKWEWNEYLSLYYCPCCNITSSKKTEFCCRCGVDMREE